MKKIHYIIITTLLLINIGCSKDKISYGDSGSETKTDSGYLITPQVISADISAETINSENTKVINTKSSNPEINDTYLVTITNTTTSTVAYNDNYGAFKAIDTLWLAQGNYSIFVRSTDNIPLIGSDAHYKGRKNFYIASNMKTELTNFECHLANIKTSINFSADFLENFKPDSDSTPDENLTVTLSIGSTNTIYNRSNTATINYFQAVEEKNTLELSISGMYNMAEEDATPNYQEVSNWKQTIEDVKAGQWRKISLRIEHANDGTATFVVEIETWTYNEEINVDITRSEFQIFDTEDELDDPENYITDTNAPTVTLGGGHNISDTFIINRNNFGLNASLQTICTDPLIFNLTPTLGSTITDMWIEFTTDNNNLNSSLTNSYGEKRRIHILPGGQTTAFDINSATEIEASLNFMQLLYNNAGTHKAVIMVKDSENRASYTNLTIESSNDGSVSPSNAPSIIWRSGLSFDERHTIDPINGLEVILDITSETGITGFTIQINSDVLTPEELAGINLAQNMDLINPGSHEAGLVALGFPVKDQVKDQTALVFNISQFMPLLAGLGSGDSDFVLTVTDAGGVTVKTLRVKAN